MMVPRCSSQAFFRQQLQAKVFDLRPIAPIIVPETGADGSIDDLKPRRSDALTPILQPTAGHAIETKTVERT
jgi:hypothetical protein